MSESREPLTDGFPRGLLPEERAVLEAMLRRHTFTGRDELLAQVDHLWATGSCPCGCATVYLESDEAVAPSAPRAPQVVPGSADVLGDDGTEVGGIIVFTKDGRLSSLEIYTYFDPINPIPPLERIRLGPPMRLS